MRAATQIRSIRTDKDHRAALAQIGKLWGAPMGTPQGDKFDVLVTPVERYEERRWPLKRRRRFDPVDVLHYGIEETRSPSSGAGRHSGLAVACVRSPGSAPAPDPRDDPKDHCKLEIPADLLVQPYRVAATAA